MKYKTILTIAGSDSCGGAGIQADLKTITLLGGYGCSAITALTAQNTTGVRSIMGCSPEVLRDQLDMVMEDFEIDAAKSGMLYSNECVKTIADCLKRHPISNYVLDPVMISTSGSRLIEEDAIHTIQKELFPLAKLVTPNLPEAEALSGISISCEEDVRKAAKEIMKSGCGAVLIKGGHRSGEDLADVLFEKGEETPLVLWSKRVDTRNTHGTGCTLSAAIATYLGFGKELKESVRLAHDYLHAAIEAGKDYKQGKGHGPVKFDWMRGGMSCEL